MTGLIGQTCKHSNVFSGLVLIGRGLDHMMFASTIRFSTNPFFVGLISEGLPPHFLVGLRVTAAIAEGKRPVTFRTRKLSLPAPMVLHWRRCGRVGRRRTSSRAG